MSAATLVLIRVFIITAATGLTFLFYLTEKFRDIRTRRVVTGLLFILALLSVGSYFNFREYRIHSHDVYHYYMGSKYSHELGYYNLYQATFIADREGSRILKPGAWIRDMLTYRRVRGARVLENRERYTSRFTEERWEEFKKDTRFFLSTRSPSAAQILLLDKGYNATPVWNKLISPLMNAIPTDSRTGMQLLIHLDLFLFLILFVLIYRAFGLVPLLFATIFIGINFMSSFNFIKGSILRMDWLFYVFSSICFLKKGRYKTAGMLAGLAAATRIFPVLFLTGLGAKYLAGLFSRKLPGKHYTAFFASFALTLVLLAGMSAITEADRKLWKEYPAKIQIHNSDIAGYRLGFKNIFLKTNVMNAPNRMTFTARIQQKFKRTRVQWWAVQIPVILLVVIGSLKLEDYETIPFSFPLIYFLTAPTFYYYVMLVIPLFLFTPKLREGPRAVGQALFFLAALTGYLLNSSVRMGFTLNYYLAWILLALCLYMFGVSLNLWRRKRPSQEFPVTGPAETRSPS